MYVLTYNHNHADVMFKNLGRLTDELSNHFSCKFIQEVTSTLERQGFYNGTFFDVKHYVGYIYDGMAYTSLYTLSQKLAKEVDEEEKVEWFIQNVGVCARKDNGDEIYLPWQDMFYDDYDSKAFDGVLSDEVDEAVADKIENELIKCKNLATGNKFVLSFWESDFTIEIEEDV